MTLIKTSLLNGIAVVIKMLTLLGINKILAIYVGPAGYAALGQFQNAMTMITTFASGAINTGVTKYTAEYHQDEAEQHAVWRTAGTIALVGSLFTAALVIFFSRELAIWFLKDEALGSVFIWFATTLVFFVFNTLLLAILNGKKEIRRYVTANIAGSLFALVITAVMTIRLGLYGALVALAVYQSLAFLVTLLLTYKATWFKLNFLVGGIDKRAARNLARYTAMALTSATCAPLSHILIRNHLGNTLGWSAAGYWEAMWRLSAAYLLLVTTTLSVYYLPRISELKDKALIKNEVILGYKIVLPMAALCGLTIYTLRDFIIEILFTKEFAPMRDLFAWQIIGDTLKIGSWIVAYVMLGKAMTRLYIATEIIFAFLFFAMTYIIVGFVGLEGVVLAYAMNYLLYWLLIFYMIRRYLSKI